MNSLVVGENGLIDNVLDYLVTNFFFTMSNI